MKMSVCVVTYNQEKYIRQCLESILEQQTNFSFEILIADDCSTDNTSKIIAEYLDEGPNKIKYYRHQKNIGAFKNFLFVHNQVTGEYVAHIDGDDYMLPNKLQRQTDFLDSHPEYNIVWHEMLFLSNMNVITQKINPHLLPIDGFTRQDLLKYGTIGIHSSKMYRSSSKISNYPDFPILDYFTDVEQIGDGKAKILVGEPLGAYRMHIGISSGTSKTLEILRHTLLYFYDKYPNHKLEINTLLFRLLIAQIFNKSDTAIIFFNLWVKTFHPLSIFVYVLSIKHIINLRFPIAK